MSEKRKRAPSAIAALQQGGRGTVCAQKRCAASQNKELGIMPRRLGGLTREPLQNLERAVDRAELAVGEPLEPPGEARIAAGRRG